MARDSVSSSQLVDFHALCSDKETPSLKLLSSKWGVPRRGRRERKCRDSCAKSSGHRYGRQELPEQLERRAAGWTFDLLPLLVPSPLVLLSLSLPEHFIFVSINESDLITFTVLKHGTQ